MAARIKVFRFASVTVSGLFKALPFFIGMLLFSRMRSGIGNTGAGYWCIAVSHEAEQLVHNGVEVVAAVVSQHALQDHRAGRVVQVGELVLAHVREADR